MRQKLHIYALRITQYVSRFTFHKMKSDSQKYIDIIEWDVVNWRKALNYWDQEITEPLAGRRALEVGGRNGGLSLYLALRGCEVVCSDFREPTQRAREIMERYGVSDRVVYESVNVTNIPYPDNAFDIVAFKSVLGNVGIHGGKARQKQAMDEIYRVLKPNGTLLFAENLKASAVLTFFREKFVKWGGAWRYMTVQEMKELTSQFSDFHYRTYGYFACFGRSEMHRRLLSLLDWAMNPFLKAQSKYIIYGYARK